MVLCTQMHVPWTVLRMCFSGSNAWKTSCVTEPGRIFRMFLLVALNGYHLIQQRLKGSFVCLSLVGMWYFKHESLLTL